MPTPKALKKSELHEGGPNSSSNDDKREKENWDELNEKIQNKRKELNHKKAGATSRVQTK
jgi:hypothetical protein